MNLRKKTLLTILLINSVLFISLLIISKSIVMDGFKDIEMDYAEQNVKRAINVLNDESKHLDTIVYDWAAWDDTYDYINNQNQNYLDSNLLDGTFTGLGLNIILYVDLNDTVIYEKTFDLETETELLYSTELIVSIMEYGIILDHPDGESSVTGLIQTNYGPMIIASRPIQNSAEDSPINGVLLMGMFFDDDTTEYLSEIVQVPLSFYTINEEKPVDFNDAELHLNESDETIFIQTIDEEIIAGYTIINDINDSSFLMLKVEMLRDIYQQGIMTFNLLQQIILVVMFIIGSVSLVTLDMLVVKRLAILDSEVRRRSSNENHLISDSISGNDEISSLAKHINIMLSYKEESEKALRLINEKQESKVLDLEQNERAALNIMEDLNDTVHILKKVEKELEFKNQELEDYTYTVSHDLKAPLVTIQGFSELLNSQYSEKLDDKAKHYLDRIKQGSENLAKLVSDLLELSRAGRKMKEFECHDFNEILGLSLDGLEGKIRENNVEIQKPDDFPNIHCDDMRLSQVMGNLIGNAINYMGEQKSPTIQLGWSENESKYEFWIQDNGIGIKDEDKGRIFNIFERAAESSAEGTGIGLAIVKKIIQIHGGDIRVESEYGNGSKFTFSIPIKGE